MVGKPLSEPAAPAAPHVTNQDGQRQYSEPDEEPVFDMADVVAAQHRQQEHKDARAGDVPGAVIDPAPSPACGRHLGDIDAGERLHLSTGHSDSSGWDWLLHVFGSNPIILAHLPEAQTGVITFVLPVRRNRRSEMRRRCR
ncbi:hypothetical protein MMAR_1833 [Mycobacterium marinum M]|uniref:Uncharacterized protein n=1 Tax=Mycobacterium marinum (strain ATCC BAA-535 / M) TaxID=216594 RepID=B2HJP6_MYCMM|nr:hypothetical protein MMAR_1833 [Mycobacterium marinum M]